MWFKAPEGFGSVSVQLQEFGPEIYDTFGRAYFRAPNHFAGLLLDIPGFSAADPPAGAPDDITETDPASVSAITQLTGQVNNLRLRIEDLNATLAEVCVERDELKLKCLNLEAVISVGKNGDGDPS